MLTEISNFKEDEEDPLKLDDTIQEDNKNILNNDEDSKFKADDRVHEGHNKCDFCGKTFSQSNVLERHIRGFHQHYKCDTCSKTFARRDGLKKHIRIVHEGHKDYKCDSCGKAWTDIRPLKNHINSGRCSTTLMELNVIREVLVSHEDNNRLKNYKQKFSCLDEFFDFVDVNLFGKKGPIDVYQFHFKCKKCFPKIDVTSDSRATFSNLKTHIRRAHPEFLREFSELRKNTFKKKKIKRKSLIIPATTKSNTSRQKLEKPSKNNKYVCTYEACCKTFFFRRIFEDTH